MKRLERGVPGLRASHALRAAPVRRSFWYISALSMWRTPASSAVCKERVSASSRCCVPVDANKPCRRRSRGRECARQPPCARARIRRPSRFCSTGVHNRCWASATACITHIVKRQRQPAYTFPTPAYPFLSLAYAFPSPAYMHKYVRTNIHT